MFSFYKPSISSITKIYKIIFASVLVLITIGCSSRHLVPVSDDGFVYPEFHTLFKTENGVTIGVNSSPWEGSPENLQRYVTPIFIEIQNNNNKNLNIKYDDIVLVDEYRTQYNPLSPQIVAEIINTTSQYAYGPGYPQVSIGLGFGYFSGGSFWGGSFYSPFYSPFYPPFYFFGEFPLGYYPPYYYPPPDVGNIYTNALITGQVLPNAKLKGFVYFQKVPEQVSQVTLDISYKVEGENEPKKLSFPFVFD